MQYVDFKFLMNNNKNFLSGIINILLMKSIHFISVEVITLFKSIRIIHGYNMTNNNKILIEKLSKANLEECIDLLRENMILNYQNNMNLNVTIMLVCFDFYNIKKLSQLGMINQEDVFIEYRKIALKLITYLEDNS